MIVYDTKQKSYYRVSFDMVYDRYDKVYCIMCGMGIMNVPNISIKLMGHLSLSIGLRIKCH